MMNRSCKVIFIEGPHEPVRHSMQSYWSTHRGSILYDLACFATSVWELQKRVDVDSKKRSDHHQNTKHRRVGRGDSAKKINFIKTGGSTAISTAKPSRHMSAVLQI